MTKHFITAVLLTLMVMLSACSSDDAKADSDTSQNDSTAVAENDSDNKDKKKGNWGENSEDDGPSAIPVETTRLTKGSISSFLLYSATLETEQTVNVFSRIGGLVEGIYVEESDRVRKGDRLMQIEKDEYELIEQNARLEYEKKLADYNRLKALQAEELLSEEEMLNSEISMKQAQISWEQAKLNLRHTTVKAPISGVIGDRMVDLGDRITTTTNLFTVANMDDKIVRAYVPQSEFTNCYKNQPANIRSDIVPDVEFKGYVKRISPIIDPQSGTFKVTVAVRDPKNHLRPGMFVNTELIVDTHDDALLLPKAALIYENERTYFFLVDADSSLKIELQKGFEDAEKVEILNDLTAGAQVVVLGQNGLKQGSKVKVIEEKTYTWQRKEKQDISAALSQK